MSSSCSYVRITYVQYEYAVEPTCKLGCKCISTLFEMVKAYCDGYLYPYPYIRILCRVMQRSALRRYVGLVYVLLALALVLSILVGFVLSWSYAERAARCSHLGSLERWGLRLRLLTFLNSFLECFSVSFIPASSYTHLSIAFSGLQSRRHLWSLFSWRVHTRTVCICYAQ